METKRCGVVICPIWRWIEGEFLILVHYVRQGSEISATAVFARYNGELKDITDKFRTLKMTPDWREKLHFI